MSWIRPLFVNLSRNQIPKHFTIPCHLNHSLAKLDPLINVSNDYTSQDWAKTISSRITNCTNIQQLNEIYAHVIRIHMLELYSAPFYWNTIIRAYTRFSSPSKALYVSIAMFRARVYPDTYTLPVILTSISQKSDILIIRQFHTVAKKHGLDTNLFCESGFIRLYAKAGEFNNARKLFDESPERNLGSWNAIIGGLSKSGRAREAVNMFLELKRSGLAPDDVTMVSVTSACGSLGDLGLSLQLHKCVLQAKTLEKSDLLMLNSLIDMYGKCGRMDLANIIFSRMHFRNVSSYTSLIVGYATHGHINKALECFNTMRSEQKPSPNGVTFVGVLTACVHGGLVEKGRHYFKIMKDEYGIEPWLEHYGCMVDLFSRSGLLEEARKMVEVMPMEGNVVIWGSLMGGCEKYGDVKMGEWVGGKLLELEPWNDGVYVVMSNIYASNGLWEDVGKMRKIMKERRLAKVPGYSLGV